MKRLFPVLGIAVALLGSPTETTAAEAFPQWVAPGPNIARGKPYTIKSAGKSLDYPLTKDAGDAVQLTDGAFAPRIKHMWWYKDAFAKFMGTVGITIDLGADRPIAGVAYSTDANPVAGVGYPPAILVLVSNDGKEFYPAGELVGLAAKFGPPPLLGRHWIRTDELKTHGRYIQLVVQSGLYVLCDEIEVYEGRPEYLKQSTTGPAITDAPQYLRDNIMPYAVSARLADDIARALVTVNTLKIPDAVKKQATENLKTQRSSALNVQQKEYAPDFRAVAPLNGEHAKTFAALSPMYRAAGYPEYFTWNSNRWVRQSPFDYPQTPPSNEAGANTVRVRLMQNDRRGEVMNIANYGSAGKAAVVSFSGLPGGAQPAYVRVRQAEYVAMESRPWDANALPLAPVEAGGWRVTLPAGMSRQLWFDFLIKPGTCPAGTHTGEVVVKIDGGPELRTPLVLTVAPTALPDKKAIAVGNWDYTHGGYHKMPDVRYQPPSALNETNTDAAVAHMNESGVSVAWAMSQWSKKDIVPYWSRTLEFNASNEMTTPPDYTTFDNWIKLRPNMRYYAVYITAAANWKGTKMGTEAFQKQITIVTKAWVAHMEKIGVDPARVIICVVDEPGNGGVASIINGWTEAIRKVEPRFRYYVNPLCAPESYTDPNVIKMFEQADIITPGTDYSYQRHGQAAVDFYEKFRAKGKVMGFYACAQNPSEGEAIRYYRLQQWACWNINKGGRESWAGFWSYADSRSNHQWNLLPCGNDRSFSPVYIDSKSVTDSKHWLAIFEGVNDYEYLLMLKDRIAAVRKAGGDTKAIDAAQKLLDTLPDEVIAAVRAGNAPTHSGAIGADNPADAAACDNARLRILDALQSLAK